MSEDNSRVVIADHGAGIIVARGSQNNVACVACGMVLDTSVNITYGTVILMERAQQRYLKLLSAYVM